MINKENADIVDIISQYINLKRMGSNYAGQCPFHPTSSYDAFRVNPSKQIYRCFNCMDKAGDVIDFVMKIEDVDFKRAIEILNLKSFNSDKKEKPKKAEPEILRNQTLMTTAVNYFKFHLQESKIAREYIKSRNITDEAFINSLNIGYAPKNGLLKYLKDCGHSEEEILTEGLVKEGKYGLYDFFRERIIFPVYSEKKSIVTITSRTIDSEAKIKHLHLSGDIRHFYNESALSGTLLIIIEGIFDCLSLLQDGFNTIATFGTGGIKPEMAKRIKKDTKVFLCFDRDSNEAGQKGCLRAIEILKEEKITNIYPVELPIIEGKKTDINELYTNHNFTKEDMKELLIYARQRY